MFHRVKSEADKTQAPNTQSNEKKDMTQGQNKADDALRSMQKNSAMPVATDEGKAVNAEAKSISTPSTTATLNEKKETAMTDTPETKNDDQAQNKAVDIPSSAYGTQPMTRAAYPGSSYTGYGAQAVGQTQPNASTSPYSNASNAASSDTRRLVIGRGITMSGEIEHCDVLLVEGTIEAALKGAKMLEISENGTFYGTVEIDEAQISGRFEGDITVNGRLTVASSGVITGSISYKELQIEAGATIDGKLTPTRDGAAASKAPARKEKSAKEMAALAKAKEIKEQQSPANADEGELFSSAAE